MPVETSKTEGELTKETPVSTGASLAKVLSKPYHSALFPELSPTTSAEQYLSLLSDTSRGMGRGISQAKLINDIQIGYGNSYTESVITERREKCRGELEGKEEPTEAKETEQVTVLKEAKKTPTVEPELKEAIPGEAAPTLEKPKPVAEKPLKTKARVALEELASKAITEGPEVEAKEEKQSVVTTPNVSPVEPKVEKPHARVAPARGVA